MRTWIVGVMAVVGCGGAAPLAPADANAARPAAPGPVASATTARAQAGSKPAQPARAELQKRTLLAKADAVNRGDMAAYVDAYAPDARTLGLTSAGFEESAKGREAIAKEQSETTSKFDVRFELGRVLLRDGLGVVEWHAAGRDREHGRPVQIRGAQVVRFAEDGRITTEASYTDQLSIAVQLGIVKGRTRGLPAFGSTEWRLADPGADDAGRVARVRDALATAWTRKDRAAYESALADDVTIDEVSMPFEVAGRGQAVELMAAYVSAMPDLTVTVDEAWAFGDTVAMVVTMSGTQSGKMFDLDATGKRLTVHGLDVVDTKGEKITRVRRYTNRIEWLSQMGMLGAGKAADKGDKADNDPPKAPVKRAPDEPRTPAKPAR